MHRIANQISEAIVSRRRTVIQYTSKGIINVAFSSSLSIGCLYKRPKQKETYSEFISRMAETYKSEFIVDNSVCKSCEVKITAKKLSGIKQHLSHPKKQETSRFSIVAVDHHICAWLQAWAKIKSSFYGYLWTFLDVDIPLYKLRHPTMARFLQKYTNNSPSESSIRKNYVPLKYTGTIEKLRLKAKGKFIWLSLDETTDVEQRLVANCVFGILSENDEAERGKCYLLDVRQIEKHDANTMAAFFNDCLSLLFPDGKWFFLKIFIGELHFYNLFTIEQVFHIKTFFSSHPMLKAMKDLRVLYPNMLHVTCFSHGLQRLCEFIRSKFENANNLVATVKMIYKKVSTI